MLVTGFRGVCRTPVINARLHRLSLAHRASRISGMTRWMDRRCPSASWHPTVRRTVVVVEGKGEGRGDWNQKLGLG